MQQYGGIELEYELGSRTTFKFDLCDVIKCGGNPTAWRGYDTYMCMFLWGGPAANPWCGHWQDVLWGTGPHYPKSHITRRKDDYSEMQGKGSFTRRSVDTGPGFNPLQLSLQDVTYVPYNRTSGKNYCKQENNTLYLALGVDVVGKDPMGLVKVVFKPGPRNETGHKVKKQVRVEHYNKVTTVSTNGPVSSEQIIRVETGMEDENVWLKWMIYTAKQANLTNCVACSSARPTLYTSPAPLLPHVDPEGFQCMLSMHMHVNPPNCSTISALFPPASNITIPPIFTPQEGNYTCLTRTNGTDVGDMPEDWCSETINVTSWSNMSRLVVARADMYWYCGGSTLYNRMPPGWSGTCTLVLLSLPIVLIGEVMEKLNTNNYRSKRSTGTNWDLSYESPTYFDAIGIPRGVPDQYKLADQVAAGWESFPIWSAFFPVTPNKNVDRINYVHYNVQRLTNLTRDAVEGISTQLAATSLMAFQNRIALDFLLAEKGGVCHMFGEMCCTFIPNNTASDGSVTKALNGLRALSIELKEGSGIEGGFGSIMDQWFGKWKGLVTTVLVTLIAAVALLALCGCCCIPCIRALCIRCITTAIQDKGQGPPPYQMAQEQVHLMIPETEQDENEQEETRFGKWEI